MSLLLSRTQGYCYHLSKFHIYALVYCIGVFLSGLAESLTVAMLPYLSDVGFLFFDSKKVIVNSLKYLKGSSQYLACSRSSIIGRPH